MSKAKIEVIERSDYMLVKITHADGKQDQLRVMQNHDIEINTEECMDIHKDPISCNLITIQTEAK